MVETRAKRFKRLRSETWDQIESAQGVFIDVLSRLPVQSIRSFQTISKYWYSAISNKYFSEKQLTQSRKNPLYIACLNMDRPMHLISIKPENIESSSLITFDPPERRDNEFMYMISSFNGLICCINQICNKGINKRFCDLQIWVCNPCTGETLLLPQGTPSFNFEPSIGVAYGSDISDYRIFRIFGIGKKIPENIPKDRVYDEDFYEEGGILKRFSYEVVYECEVYSSHIGSWRNIGHVPCVPMYSHFSPYRSSHVFVGGKIYWLSSLDDPGKILSVDLDGKFGVIGLPHYPSDLNEEDRITDATYLINLRGSLSVVVIHVEYMDIWVCKEDGKKSSWTLVCEDHTPFDEDEEVVLAVTSIKNQILCMTETYWCSYDMDSRIWLKGIPNHDGFTNPAVFPFTESVLPCNGGVML